MLPGRKQVFRVERNGLADHDVLGLHDEPAAGRPLLQQVMKHGTRLPEGRVGLNNARAYAAGERGHLPAGIRNIEQAKPPYRVDIGPVLAAHRDELQRARKP